MLQKVVSEAATNFFSFFLFSFLVVRSDLEPIQKVAKETTDSVAGVVIFPLTEAVAASEFLPRSDTHFMEMQNTSRSVPGSGVVTSLSPMKGINRC